MFSSKKLLRILSNITYFLLLILIIIFAFLSAVALLSQAVRHAPNRNLNGNINALVIGVSYAVVLGISLLFCLNRRLAVRLRLQRISKAYTIIRRGDVPHPVHEYMTQEYMRTCLISYESLPTDVFHPGWGRPGKQYLVFDATQIRLCISPGTKYEGIRFRRALLDTIQVIDTLAHEVIPAHPSLKPHARMLHHFRFILPLLTTDDPEFTPLHYYDSAIQLARNSSTEPTEEEFTLGMQAADEIVKSLNDCRLEALESSITDFEGSTAES
ncbi:hypothetical protein R3P38DRAFT_44798 [Favolaschia claudopus]|uniref:Defect at low temperature protein 1 n=1 Tax=Favolaschia claudopus TaxID=2862362 RepID=A0AAW0EJE6_9AGAR